MLIRIAKASDPASSEITPRSVYLDRRAFMAGTAGLATLTLGGCKPKAATSTGPGTNAKLADVKEGYRKLGSTDTLTTYDAVTSYNNFYEFGTDKEDPAKQAHRLKPRPWTVKVDGLCNKPGTIDFDDLVKPHALEERIFRLRCVEGWSMVIPWVGFSLGDLLKRFEPQGSAKFVQFETLVRPAEMIGQKDAFSLKWPYVEGLRMDEAMHPLATVAVGLYGEVLPNQNGAPIRVVLPWKYGFKSAKSIVRISFVEDEPRNTWKVMQSREYGFYSNVNPNVDHPRWSQKTERRIGDFRRRDTLMFNGYEDEVASLYAGMDLKKYF